MTSAAREISQAQETVQDVRQRTCQQLAEELETLGRQLWVSSYVRRDAGDEATALVVQTAGALGTGATLLLRNQGYYAAGSLLRQLIEVEYLLYEFGQTPENRAVWLREAPETRPHKFSPKALRQRAKGTFSAKQYGTHCRMGGHPTPDARGLLPDHSPPYDVGVMLWEDLGEHLVGIWERTLPLLATGLSEEDVEQLRARIGRLAQEKRATVPPSRRLFQG